MIHRSENRLIVAGNKTQYNDCKFAGWNSKITEPYKPIGTFQKVVPILEELKEQLEHTNDLKVLSQKQI